MQRQRQERSYGLPELATGECDWGVRCERMKAIALLGIAIIEGHLPGGQLLNERLSFLQHALAPVAGLTDGRDELARVQGHVQVHLSNVATHGFGAVVGGAKGIHAILLHG